MPVDWNNMLGAIAFYSQGPDFYFQYRWFSHNDNCSHNEQGAFSITRATNKTNGLGVERGSFSKHKV